MNILIDLFLTFAKIGLFIFGGGYAMIPIIENNCVERKQWITHDEMMDITVIAESTPGPIMVNLATYIGSSQAGFLGAVIATLAVVLPSFLIILLVTALLKTALKNKYVQAILRGLKPCVIGIVLATGIYMVLGNCFGAIAELSLNVQSVIITAVLAAAMIGYKHIAKKKLSPILLIVLSAAVGIAVYGV